MLLNVGETDSCVYLKCATAETLYNVIVISALQNRKVNSKQIECIVR